MADDDVLKAVKRAFSGTVSLKLQQFYSVVPKGSNPDLTGKFVEEVVRGFVQQWISPCQLCHGTLHPHDNAPNLGPDEHRPRQIDGIVYDHRLGPAVIREGSFVVTHPAFCRGIIEIKTSVTDVNRFEEDLKARYRQYLAPAWQGCGGEVSEGNVMGIVVQDSEPKRRRGPDWMGDYGFHDYSLAGHCPIFFLFKEANGNYEPYEPGIDALIKAVYQTGLQREYASNRIQGGPLPR
jgi:hypothetical protein